MAVAFVKNHTVTFNKTAGTNNLALTLDTAVPAGNLLVARLVYDNAGTASKPLVSTIAVAAGETATWTALGAVNSTSTSAGSFASGAMLSIRTTQVWPAGSYTVTLDTSTVQKAGFLQEFSGVLSTTRSTGGTAYSTTTTAASAATTGTAPVTGDLALGFIFGSNVAAAQAGDTDTTSGSWSTVAGVGSTGSSGATNNYGVGQYKILTGANHQTLNNSAAMTAGNGAIAAVLQQYVPPAVTQAAYRIYADGTEGGSTALAAQDTAPTIAVAGGDQNIGVRLRIQSTGGGAPAATDDWQLQYDKNTSGTWVNVGATDPALAVSQPIQNASGDLYLGSFKARAESFLGNGRPLARARFWLVKVGAPTGSVTARLYGHTGTFGSGGLPNSTTPLQTSSPVDITTLSTTTPDWVAFDFDSTVTLTDGVPYFIGPHYQGGNSTNFLFLYNDSSSATSPGNWTQLSSTDVWTAITGSLTFEVYTATDPTTAVPHDSVNLTDGAATTSRLTGGTGTFAAGKISEDGLADNLGWAVGNHTELLYSVTLKQADLTVGDTLRFRVLRNGATTEFTYTQYPSVTIGAGGPVTVGGVASASVAVTATVAGTVVHEIVTGTSSATVAVAVVAVGRRRYIGTSLSTVAVTVAATGRRVVKATTTATVAVTVNGAGTVIAQIITGTSSVNVAVNVAVVGRRTVKATSAVPVALTVAAAGTVAGGEIITGTATSSVAVTVTATGRRIVKATVGVAEAVNVTATGTVIAQVVTGTAAGTVAVSVTATGKRVVRATSAGSVAVSVAAVGRRRHTGTVTRPISVSVVATGTVIAQIITGTVTRPITLTVAATGRRVVRATGSSSVAVGATAMGIRFKPGGGTVIIPISVSVTATGKRITRATAAAAVAVTVGATGRRVIRPTITIPVAVTVTAAGHRLQRGVVAVPVALQATATGHQVWRGTATVSVAVAATASGGIAVAEGVRLNEADALYLGTTPVDAIYAGSVHAWP